MSDFIGLKNEDGKLFRFIRKEKVVEFKSDLDGDTEILFEEGTSDHSYEPPTEFNVRLEGFTDVKLEIAELRLENAPDHSDSGKGKINK
jgi:hypothetical protein